MNRQVIIYKDPESDWFIAEIPSLPGCVTQGKTYDEAVEMAKDAAEVWIETLKDLGEPVPEAYHFSVAEVTTPA